jgi:LysM repeat protein
MPTEARRRHAAIILIGALALIGCGGDDDDTTTGDSGSNGASSNTTSSLTPLTTPPTTAAATTTTLAQYYEVQPGDSLSGIAQQFDIRLEDLIAANGIVDPNVIQVGQQLLLPPPTVLVNPDGSTTTVPLATADTSSTVAG